jgi:hypothetical protein
MHNFLGVVRLPAQLHHIYFRLCCDSQVPTATLSHLQAKAALVEETEYQLEELEKVNEHLSNTVAQLQKGKVKAKFVLIMIFLYNNNGC